MVSVHGGRYARVVDHLAVRDVAQGAPLEGGSTLHPKHFKYFQMFLACRAYHI